MINIAIFASGSGSNAQKIIEHFTTHTQIQVVAVLSNNPQALVLEKAAKFQVPTYTFTRSQLYQSEEVIEILKKHKADWIVLAGFLWLVPGNMIKAFPNHIVNIHPALLPAYGGKGMYGAKVHEAVVKAREKFSGITIHLVNEEYDKGAIIFQAQCPIEPNDTPEDVAHKVQVLEHTHFPDVIEKMILGKGV